MRVGTQGLGGSSGSCPVSFVRIRGSIPPSDVRGKATGGSSLNADIVLEGPRFVGLAVGRDP